jgi:hypothetical protein
LEELMDDESRDTPLTENEAALFMAISALVQVVPGGPQRKMLAGLLEIHREALLAEKRPQGAALLGILATYAESGPA